MSFEEQIDAGSLGSLKTESSFSDDLSDCSDCSLTSVRTAHSGFQEYHLQPSHRGSRHPEDNRSLRSSQREDHDDTLSLRSSRPSADRLHRSSSGSRSNSSHRSSRQGRGGDRDDASSSRQSGRSSRRRGKVNFRASTSTINWMDVYGSEGTGQEGLRSVGRMDAWSLNSEVGIHWGPFLSMAPHTVSGHADYFGPIVTRAVRVAAQCEPGQVCVGIPMGDGEKPPDPGPSVDLELLGVKQLKGIKIEMAIFACRKKDIRKKSE